ncbi:uncharacterized protein LOC133202515 [Saccostrea echinata]|uniref:uncharacterized protein LOC133202515 n=1 Tax=Saccostrea echinata TaxID=191078 RepID=UPI002A8002CE|nr:uncharacterized protein LOC133202515 [Saccostrea echinata]
MEDEVNDIDYLNDIIPYRCPKCRDERKFSSLSDLRLHLEKNHSYQVGYVRPHSRTQVFDAKSVKTKHNTTINKGFMREEPSCSRNGSLDGRSSPLLLSFKEDARILESELKAAKEAERRNKMRSKNGENGKIDESGTIHNLHHKLMSSRSRQWRAEEALYNIDSVLENLEKSAEKRFQDQRGVINDLVSNLDNREEQLSQANTTLQSLQRERQKLMRETQEMLQQSEIKNERLVLELERRDDILHSVEGQLKDLRVKTEESIRLKDNELLVTKDRVHQLELEKETLVRDVEELLMATDRDNTVLKQTLDSKERQLKLVNNELLKIRNEQSDLMDESMKLYEAAERGNQKLEKVIQTKDSKLHQAENELFRIKKMQENLVSESQLLTEQADSHSQAMRKVLTDKEGIISSIRQELVRVTEERDRLLQTIEQAPVKIQASEGINRTEAASSLNTMGIINHHKQELHHQEDITLHQKSDQHNQRDITPVQTVNNSELSKLQTVLEEKQTHLEEKERELESLRQFINTTAEKETVARKKLEEFISELIDRADRAERELDMMRREAKKTVHQSADIPERDVQNIKENQRLQPSRIPECNQITANSTLGSSALHSSLARHLVEATVEPWQKSFSASAVNISKENLHQKDFENINKEDIKPVAQRNSRRLPPKRNRAHQPNESKSFRALQNQSSNDTVVSPDEDSTEYSPLPVTKFPERRQQFQRTDSNQSYVSQRHGWMDPDSVLYSEVMDDSELEKVSVESFNKLPDELHQICGSDAKVVYIPFNRKTGQPIKMEPHQEIKSDLNTQQNLDHNPSMNQLTQKTLSQEENDQDEISDSFTSSHTEFKEIQSRQKFNRQNEPRNSKDNRKTESRNASLKSSNSGNHPNQRAKESSTGKVVMKSIGVMADIPSFQGTSTESESCEEMEMADNSLSDVNSFSEDYPMEKQDSFEKEVDENGIIWGLDEQSHNSLMESRRFSPYGSEMKSSSSQGGALLDESDSLDDIPVRDQTTMNWDYHSEDNEKAELSSASFHTYPTVRKQVNFQTISGHSDPTHYGGYKRSNKHRFNSKNIGYDILANDTDEDDYYEDIQRWKDLTADVNTDLQREMTETSPKLPSFSRMGRPENPRWHSRQSSVRSPVSTRSDTFLSRQKYSRQKESHPVYSSHSVLPFGEPPQRTMSSPGLYKRYIINEDIPHFHRNFHSPISLSWGPSFKRERFTRNVGNRLSSSLSNLNQKPSTELYPKTSICKDSTTQTWLLDRQLTEKDLHFMKEISSSVSSSDKTFARNSHLGSPTQTSNQKSESVPSYSTMEQTNKRSTLFDGNSSSSLSVKVDNHSEQQEQNSGRSGTSNDNKLQGAYNTSSANMSKDRRTPNTDNPLQTPSESISSKSHSSIDALDQQLPERTKLGSDETESKIQIKDDADPNDSQKTYNSNIIGERPCPQSSENSRTADSNDSRGKMADERTKLLDNSNLTEDEFRNQSLNSTQTSDSDAHDSKHLAKKSSNCEQRRMSYSDHGTNDKGDDSQGYPQSSFSMSDSKSATNPPSYQGKSYGEENLSRKSSPQSKSATPEIKYIKSTDNNSPSSENKQRSSNNTETFCDPDAISFSHESKLSGDLTEDADDTSVLTDLSIDSHVADISNQSSNFSTFFKNSSSEKQKEERVNDPDKDLDCHEEPLRYLHSNNAASEGTSDKVLEAEHKMASPTSDFEPFSMAFETKPTVFSEPQETEDEDDLSTLDSCSVTISSSEGGRVLTNHREETRKRRRALHNIFQFLDIESLLMVAQVCREWKKVSRNRSLWKQVVLENRKCSSKFLISLSSWCTSMEQLTLRNLSPRNQWQTEADDVYQSTIRGSLEPGLERLLQVSESSLKSISIISCGALLTDKSIWLVSCYSRMLRSVEYLSDSFPLGPDVMYALGAGCRDITTLMISPIFPCENEEKFSNKCLQIVSQFCCDLEILSIGGSKIDINGLVLIAKACQRLHQLDLHHCQEMTSDTAVAICRLGLKQLLSLSFVHTPITADALKHFYNSCKHLKSLHVALSIMDFHKDKSEKEEVRLKKWQKFVKDMKSLENIPGLGNILKLNLQHTCNIE